MAATNLVDSTSLKRFFTELKRLDADVESAKGRYMKECQERSARRAAILEAAEGAGIPKRELKTVFKRYKLEQKIEALDDAFDDAAVYEAMVQGIGEAGDLPLFASALDKAKPQNAKASRAAAKRQANSAAIDSLVDGDGAPPSDDPFESMGEVRPPHLQRIHEDADAEAAARNAAALSGGIKTLN